MRIEEYMSKMKINKIRVYKEKIPLEIGIATSDFKPNSCDGCHTYGECDEDGDPPCLCDAYVEKK